MNNQVIHGLSFGHAVKGSKSIDLCQPAWTAQADSLQYILQMHLAPFSKSIRLPEIPLVCWSCQVKLIAVR